MEVKVGYNEHGIFVSAMGYALVMDREEALEKLAQLRQAICDYTREFEEEEEEERAA